MYSNPGYFDDICSSVLVIIEVYDHHRSVMECHLEEERKHDFLARPDGDVGTKWVLNGLCWKRNVLMFALCAVRNIVISKYCEASTLCATLDVWSSTILPKMTTDIIYISPMRHLNRLNVSRIPTLWMWECPPFTAVFYRRKEIHSYNSLHWSWSTVTSANTRETDLHSLGIFGKFCLIAPVIHCPFSLLCLTANHLLS